MTVVEFCQGLQWIDEVRGGNLILRVQGKGPEVCGFRIIDVPFDLMPEFQSSLVAMFEHFHSQDSNLSLLEHLDLLKRHAVLGQVISELSKRLSASTLQRWRPGNRARW